MSYDPSKPADHSPLSSSEMREQLNALKALIDAQAAEIAALQTPFPSVIEIASLSYDSGTTTMQIAYAPTGGDNATEQTLVWWVGTGSPNRVPLTRPSQSVSVSGIVDEMTFWQTEEKNAAGVIVLSTVQSYYVS